MKYLITSAAIACLTCTAMAQPPGPPASPPDDSWAALQQAHMNYNAWLMADSLALQAHAASDIQAAWAWSQRDGSQNHAAGQAWYDAGDGHDLAGDTNLAAAYWTIETSYPYGVHDQIAWLAHLTDLHQSGQYEGCIAACGLFSTRHGSSSADLMFAAEAWGSAEEDYIQAGVTWASF